MSHFRWEIFKRTFLFCFAIAILCAIIETLAVMLIAACIFPLSFFYTWLGFIITLPLGAVLGVTNGIVIGYMLAYKDAYYASHGTDEQPPFPTVRRRIRWAALIVTVITSALVVLIEMLSHQETGASLIVTFGSPLIIAAAFWSAKKVSEAYPALLGRDVAIRSVRRREWSKPFDY